MNKLLFVILFTSFAAISVAQENSIIGAWYSNDSMQTISLFLKPDGTVLMHSGKAGSVIIPEKMERGKYELKENTLSIQWSNGITQNYKIIFLDKHGFELTAKPNSKKKPNQVLIFRRVRDEEVINEKE